MNAEQWGTPGIGLYARCQHCGKVITLKAPRRNVRTEVKDAAVLVLKDECGPLTHKEIMERIYTIGRLRKELSPTMASVRLDDVLRKDRSFSYQGDGIGYALIGDDSTQKGSL